MLKKLFYLLFSFIIILNICGCEKKDSNGNSINDFVGSWKLVSSLSEIESSSAGVTIHLAEEMVIDKESLLKVGSCGGVGCDNHYLYDDTQDPIVLVNGEICYVLNDKDTLKQIACPKGIQTAYTKGVREKYDITYKKSSGKESTTENKDNREGFTYIDTLTNLEEENVILTNGCMLIANDTVYAFNFDKIFSNNSNYKELGTTSNLIGLTRSYDEIYNDSEHLIFNNSENKLSCSVQDGCIEESKIKLDNFVTLLNGVHSSSRFIHGLFVSNNELYYFSDSEEKQKIDTSILDNEKIVAIYSSSSIYKFYIKTDKSFYLYDGESFITNEEECDKYPDVNCNDERSNELVKEEKLTKYYNDIKFIANDIVVFNDNKVYSFN